MADPIDGQCFAVLSRVDSGQFLEFRRQDQKLGVLADEFSEIEMNLDVTVPSHGEHSIVPLRRSAVASESLLHVTARPDQMLVAMLVMPPLAKQVSQQSLGIRTSRDIGHHKPIVGTAWTRRGGHSC